MGFGLIGLNSTLIAVEKCSCIKLNIMYVKPGNGPYFISWLLCCLPLQKLYDSIRNEPFKIPEDDGNDLTHTFFNPDREGWLLKLGETPNNMVMI